MIRDNIHRPEYVGMNEYQHRRYHPELRLANIALRSHGWKDGKSSLTAGAGNIYPLGKYTLSWEGSNDLSLEAGNRAIKLIDYSFDDDLNKHIARYEVTEYKPVGLFLKSKSPSNLSNIDLRADDIETIGSFTKQFVDDLKQFHIFRSMDLSQTNSNPQVNWSDRTTLEFNPEAWLSKGWPWELIIELANVAQVDLWVCVPHAANQEYKTKLAELINNTLDPKLTLYIEYTNEAWNTAFAFGQSRWIRDNFTSGSPREQEFARHKAYGRLSAKTFEIFKRVCDKIKVKTVLGGQSGAPRVLREALEGLQETNIKPDVCSFATYINASDSLRIYYDSLVNKTLDVDYDKVFEIILNNLENVQKQRWQNNFDTIANLDCEAIAYEGGQHLVAKFSQHNDNKYIEFLESINRHEKMGFIYDRAAEIFRSLGGSGTVYFQRLAKYSNFGFWGKREFVGDNSPKFRAIIRHLNQANKINNSDSNMDSKKEILVLKDGGRGDSLDWRGMPASKYDSTNPVIIKLPEEITPPFSVQFCFKRVGLGFRNDIIGMCEAVRFTSDKHKAFAACDVGEPQLKAVRSRHVDLTDGKVLLDGPGGLRERIPFIQNGSTKANSGEVWDEGKWHHATVVFDSTGPNRDLFAYIDTLTSTVQAPLPRDQVRSNFDIVSIGRCFGGDATLELSEIRVVEGIISPEESAKRSESLGIVYGQNPIIPERPVDPEPSPEPDPEPQPDPNIILGTYRQETLADGSIQVTLIPSL